MKAELFLKKFPDFKFVFRDNDSEVNVFLHGTHSGSHIGVFEKIFIKEDNDHFWECKFCHRLEGIQ